MKNNIFKYILKIIVFIVVLFTVAPLGLLVIRGGAKVIVAFKAPETNYALRLSLLTATISTLICLFFALPTAYVLARNKTRLNKVLLVLIFLPMSLPHIISGIALILFLGNPGVGKYLSKIGIDFVFTKKGVVAAQIFVNLPFMIQIIKNAIEELDYKMEFTARTLGCTEFQGFRYVTIPLVRHGIISSIVMTWSRALGEFGAVVMLAGATSYKTEVLSTSIFMNMSTGDLDLALGTSIILIILSLFSVLIFEIINKQKDRGD